MSMRILLINNLMATRYLIFINFRLKQQWTGVIWQFRTDKFTADLWLLKVTTSRPSFYEYWFRQMKIYAEKGQHISFHHFYSQPLKEKLNILEMEIFLYLLSASTYSATWPPILRKHFTIRSSLTSSYKAISRFGASKNILAILLPAMRSLFAKVWFFMPFCCRWLASVLCTFKHARKLFSASADRILLRNIILMAPRG